jgi:hypothetical protein
MLYSIHGGQVEGYRDGQVPVVHLVSSAGAVAAVELPFTYTDGHAEIQFSKFYEGSAGLRSRIDWDVMTATYCLVPLALSTKRCAPRWYRCWAVRRIGPMFGFVVAGTTKSGLGWNS